MLILYIYRYRPVYQVNINAVIHTQPQTWETGSNIAVKEQNNP